MRVAFTIALALAVCCVGSGHTDSQVRHFTVTAGGKLYGLTVSVEPDRIVSGEIIVTARDGRGVIVEKSLHAFDPDLSVMLRPRVDGEITVELAGHNADADAASIAWQPIANPGPGAAIAALPNREWRDAQEFALGQTVFGSGDDRPYAPASAGGAYAGLMAGVQWLRFTSHETQPKLVYFALDVTDRDVPADVDVFCRKDDEMVPYRDGASAYTPEATQNFPGLMKFRTRIVKPGETYYVRVAANHPAWQLRTETYNTPPYRDAQEAVRAGMNYLVRLGDAWHANMPRRGAVALRNTMPHAEAQSCIACHPTQFTARGYLTAVKNGYPATNRPAIDFLLDRLRNNPRPLYGQESADWARVIFSARTVASRVPVLLDMQERLLGGPRASDVTHGYASYLKLHWEGRAEMAGDEADGSQPAVSPFEIGLQTWQTYGLAARDFPGENWNERRQAVERMLVAAKAANVIDLGWKLTALATIDRGRYRDEIATLQEEIYRWQRADGRLPYAFDAKAPVSDFITYQAMYALAVAGERPESDPRLAKMVACALHSQRPEGSWQGDPVYKGFDTPFRDTQFAVMALSELFPYTGEKTRAKTDVELLGKSDSVLRREASARESRDRDALVQALGDPSKLVRRAAAEPLRRMGGSGIEEALRSNDARTRWGALRVFDSHFRGLTRDDKLFDSVVAELNDPAPQNRFEAAKALWQWYAWQPRPKILDALAGRIETESDATVRRGLSESVYNVLDENTGQLAAWQRAMATDAQREATEKALHATAREQSEILARHIKNANREARMTLLTGLWDFHVRHMAIPDDSRGKVDVILPAFYSEFAQGVARLGEKDFDYAPYREASSFRYSATNGFQIVRLGNDSDLIHLFADSGSALEQALLACLDGADRELTLEVIKAGSVLGEAATPKFTAAMLGLLDHGDAEVRAAVRYVYEENARGRLTLGQRDELAPLLAELLDPKKPEALAVVLPLIASLEPTHPLVHNWPVMGNVEALLRDPSVPSYAEVLRAAAAFPRLADEPLMRAQILETLQLNDERAGAAAVELVVSRYATDFTVGALAKQFMNATHGRLRAMLLDDLDPTKYTQRITAANSYNGGGGRGSLPADNNLFSSSEVVELVAESLDDPALTVREAARDLVAEHKELAAKVSPPTAPRAAPDYAFFVSRVEPILNRVGADGKACAMCHASHALFKLRPGRSRDNFESALKVADTAEPRKSLILIKPTRPNDSAGDPNLYLATHNGGERWAANEASTEYQTILEWIRGARLSASAAETVAKRQ